MEDFLMNQVVDLFEVKIQIVEDYVEIQDVKSLILCINSLD